MIINMVFLSRDFFFYFWENFIHPVDAGYTIPAGWGVMVCPPAVHLNPEIYEDPLAFDPWRWQVCALFSACKAAKN